MPLELQESNSAGELAALEPEWRAIWESDPWARVGPLAAPAAGSGFASLVLQWLAASHDQWQVCDLEELAQGVPMLRTEEPPGLTSRSSPVSVCPVVPLPARWTSSGVLNERGYRVVVFTVRWAPHVQAWLAQHGLADYVAAVTDKKPPAHVYVDDRAICFEGNFSNTLDRIGTFKAHWE